MLGDHAGYLAVPIAWAIGYPIAFAVLVFYAIHTLQWSVTAYVRAVGGVALCIAASAVVALGVRFALVDVASWIRLVAIVGTVVIVTGLLLAYTQNLSPWTALRSMRHED